MVSQPYATTTSRPTQTHAHHELHTMHIHSVPCHVASQAPHLPISCWLCPVVSDSPGGIPPVALSSGPTCLSHAGPAPWYPAGRPGSAGGPPGWRLLTCRRQPGWRSVDWEGGEEGWQGVIQWTWMPVGRGWAGTALTANARALRSLHSAGQQGTGQQECQAAGQPGLPARTRRQPPPRPLCPPPLRCRERMSARQSGTPACRGRRQWWYGGVGRGHGNKKSVCRGFAGLFTAGRFTPASKQQMRQDSRGAGCSCVMEQPRASEQQSATRLPARHPARLPPGAHLHGSPLRPRGRRCSWAPAEPRTRIDSIKTAEQGALERKLRQADVLQLARRLPGGRRCAQAKQKQAYLECASVGLQ